MRDERRPTRLSCAHADVSEMCKDLEDCSSTDDVCRELLRNVHPDRAGDRSYSADEVAAMLNTVRDGTLGWKRYRS